MEIQPSLHSPQVLLLIDWDNLFYGLFNRFGGVEGMHIEERLDKLLKWVSGEIGIILGGHGFVFAPEHLTLIHQQMCIKHGLILITCPKRHLQEPRMNIEKGRIETEEDTVDQTIIDFAKMMIGHPDLKTILLVSGDNDYVPLFEELGRRGILRALAPPTLNSLAKKAELINLVDINPKTGKKMLLVLDEI